MRLIDADALHDALRAKQKWVVRCGDKHNEGYTYDQVHFAIDDAPTVDAVEVVRCGECKHREAGNGFCEGRGWPMQLVPDDGFCDKGERRTE